MDAANRTPDQNVPAIAIVCGGGTVPAAVAEAAQRAGRRVVLFPVRGWADPELIAPFPHHWIALGQLGRFVRLARAENCREVVFIGNALRPSLRSIRFDLPALLHLPKAIAMFRGGDDHLLGATARLFEDYGFHLLGAHEVAPEILMPEGAMGQREPTAREHADIERALGLIHAIGPFDIGQGAVVADQYVLAVEAAEGTDNMLARVVELRRQGRIPTPAGVGVLVKAPKPGQDNRFDLPAIGPKTVAEVARAGLAGLAVIAGRTIVAEPALVARAAERAKVFVVGLRDEPVGSP
jgi:DUF1009 family protein